MKATGIVRKIDELGRIVLPIETRKVLGINTRDALEIFTDDDKIVLRKYAPACIFCGSDDDTTNYDGKLICRECYEKIGKSFGK